MFAMVQAAALKVSTSVYLAVSSVGSTTAGSPSTYARSGGSGFKFDVHPNKSLPGTDSANTMLGGGVTYAILGCIAAAVIGCVLIAWGGGSHNPHKKYAGWGFLAASFVGLMILGGINVFGSSALDAGSHIDAGS